MTSAPTPAALETLLKQRSWMRGLAFSLVRDDGFAEDAVQDALVARASMAHAGAGSEGSGEGVRAWLARVVRNKAIDRLRAERTRERYETAAPPAAPQRSPEAVVADAEAHERVVRAVLELEEPYRSTILLRFFEDRPPRDVAEAMDVPVETVRTRTRRALERLRTRLDESHGGDRRAWVAALLPIAEIRDAAPAASALTVGAIVMGLKTKASVLTAAAALLIGLGAGFFGGAAASEGDRLRDDVERLTTRLDVAEELAESQKGELAAARAEARSTGQALATARDELAAQQRETADLKTEHAALIERAVAAERRLGDQAAPPARFAAADYPVLDKIDWETVGASVKELLPLIETLMNAIRDDKQLTPEELAGIQNSNVPLMSAAMQIAGQIPGEGANGSYANPAFLANLIDATLRAAEKPLTIAQSDTLARLVDEAREREEQLGTTYDERTLILRRMADQIASRSRFTEGAFGLLSTEQVQLLRPDNVRGRVVADLFDASVQWGMFVRPMWHSGNRASLGRDIYRDFLKQVKPAEEMHEDIQRFVTEWTEQVPDELVEQTADGFEKMGYGRAEDVARSAEHALTLYERIARELPLSREAMTRLVLMAGPPLPLRRP